MIERVGRVLVVSVTPKPGLACLIDYELDDESDPPSPLLIVRRPTCRTCWVDSDGYFWPWEAI